MNRKILFGAGMVLLTTLFSGCAKDDDVSGEIKDNYLKVKIDGVEKSFPTVEAHWVEGGNYLTINAMDNGKESVTITVMNESTRVPAGQYSLDDASAYSIVSIHNRTSSSTQVNSAATRGTQSKDDSFNLKIDKIDNGSFQGTFSGTLIRVEGLNTLGKVTLTDGEFKSSIAPN